MQLTMEQRIFNVKSYYKTKSYNQVQTKFRILFPERLPPPNKTLNMNNERSRRGITTRKQNNEAVQQASVKNEKRISIRRNGLGTSLSSFCQIINNLR